MPLPTNSQLRSGIAGSSLPGSDRFRDGYPIYATSSNPTDVINTKIKDSVIRDSGKYTFPQDLPPIHMNIIETDWDHISGANRPGISSSLKPRKIFRLPLPMQLKDAFDVQYDTNFSLNPATGAVNQIASLVPGGQGFLGGIGAVTGLAVNTFKTVTLSQPNFKRHQLTWKLAPKNYKEAESIQRIAYQLRKGMTPKRSSILSGFVMTFPYIYLCYFSPNPKFLYKFKPCVIERIEMDYTGGNPIPAFYRPEGADENRPPESVVLQLSLLELEYWLDGRDDQKTDYHEHADGSELPTNDPLDVYNYYAVNGATAAAASTDTNPTVPG